MKTDFHIHTSFCDGQSTAEQTVIAAIEKGFTAIGFSGHSYTFFDESYCMSKENTQKYVEEISRLKAEYKGKIEIYCGIEQDFYAEPPTYPYDYVIGSVHYLKLADRYYGIDDSEEDTKNLLENHFRGDFCAFAERYFSSVKKVVEKTNADIIGHLDLITKYKHALNLTETCDYLELGYSVVKELVKWEKPFEINVGAISSGYRNSPYPSLSLLEEINRLGGKIIISGDCHNAQKLGDNLDLAKDIAQKAGFTKQTVITPNGFCEIDI